MIDPTEQNSEDGVLAQEPEPVPVSEAVVAAEPAPAAPGPVDADLADEPAPQAAAPMSTKDKIRRAQRPYRVVNICLQTDLQERYEALHAALGEAVARERLDSRLNTTESKRIAGQIEALQAEMADYVIPFKIRALGPRAWGRLEAEHPPRDGNADDLMIGYNPETFFDAAIRACTVEPADLDDEDWRILLGSDDDEPTSGDTTKNGAGEDGEDDGDGKLTPKQYAELQGAVMALNVRKIEVPNSYAASRILRAGEPE